MNARSDRPHFAIRRNDRHAERNAIIVANGINANRDNGRTVEIMLTDGSRVSVEEARPVMGSVEVLPVGGDKWRRVHPEELL